MDDAYRAINNLCQEIYQDALKKGWYEIPRRPAEVHMLVVGEIAEATEEVRNGTDPVYFKEGKPEGELIELADAVIRILDYCGSKNWELGNAIQIKRDFNKTRPHRHGGKLL